MPGRPGLPDVNMKSVELRGKSFSIGVRVQTTNRMISGEIITQVLVPWVGMCSEQHTEQARLLAPIGPTIDPKLAVYKTMRSGHLIGSQWVSFKKFAGQLRQSGKALPIKIEVDRVIGETQFGGEKVTYALRMHEELAPAGPMNLGYTSKRQPAQPEGPVGGHFIERAYQFHAQDDEKALALAMTSYTLGKGKP